jgi:hypothetical protein
LCCLSDLSVQVAFGVGSNATMAGPSLSTASLSLANGAATVTIHLDNAAGLALQPAKVCEKIKPYPQAGEHKTSLFEPFIYIIGRFTKTGSGQT